MKTRICFYYLFILLALFFFSYGAEDSCPTGMRKLYVDDKTMQEYGSGRAFIAAVAYFQFPGSLFFRRKVLIEPRFEVHLKATIDPVDIVEKTREQKLYGFTIVISGYKNTISGLEARSYKGDEDLVFNDIGYNNFVNSLIIEFDFEKDYYDPDSNSFSVRFCKTSCASEDYKAMYYNRLNSQRYDKTRVNNWDFRLIYDTKKLYLYSGPNEVIYSVNIDLEDTLGTNIGFVGFTGFMESNRREISLIGSFICEDNYEIKKMPGYFFINGELYESAGYQAGTPINYLFYFINNRDQVVPHTYGYNIWDYNFTLNTDCGLVSYTMNKQTNYTLILSINACTKAGIHTINIAEKLKGDAPLRYYIVHPGPLNQITLIGHDGIIGTVPMKYDNYLNYGDSPKGDFVFKKDLKLVLDFEVTDQYGNQVTLDSPGTLFNLKKVNENGDTSTVTSNIISYTMEKVDNHYQMTLSVSKIGTYQIDNSKYMSQHIRFIVIPGEANPNLSFCTLSNNLYNDYSSPPNLQAEETVFYNCYLRDDNGNEIDTKTFIDNSIYDFSCQTQRTSPNTKTYANSYVDKSSFFSCQYTTSDTGSFQINGYLTKKGTSTSTKINPKINQFSVRGNANSLTIKYVLNLYTMNWVDANGAEITYVSQTNGKLTVLDLAESNGGSLISTYGKYPEGFDVNKIKAELGSPHDVNYRYELVPKIEVFEGAEYIVLYTKNNVATDTLITRSSFDYTIKITLQKDKGNEEKTVTIKYILNIGSYVTCFHNFAKEKTYLDQSYELQFLTGGAERKIAKIELRTVDNYLYNYDIGKDKIQYVLEPANYLINFRVVPLSIEGTYDVYVKSNSDYQGFLIVYVDGFLLRKQWVSSQQSLACYLEFVNPEYFTHLGDEFKEHYYDYEGPFVEGNLLFQFIIKDKFGNIIAKDDYFSCYADIYCLQYGNDITKFTIFYNHTASAYQFRDKLPFESRKYTWVFFMRDSSCNNKYYINYDGMRGGTPVSVEKSYYNLLNTDIYLNEFAYVDVYYKDINGQFLGLQNNKLEEMKKKTKVIARCEDKDLDVEFEFDSINSNYAIRYKQKFTVPGTFKVTAKLEDKSLRCQTSDILNVIDNIYSLKHSKLKLILDTIIDMDPNIRVTIDNTVQEPVYKLYFYSASGVKTTYDQNIKFSCVMSGDQVSMDLDVTKNTDYVQFTHKEALKIDFKALTRGDYTLRVADNKESVDYPLYLTGDGSNDTTNDPNLLIDKTEVYPSHINGVAGKTYTINVEFRVNGGYRWNYDVETSKFSFSNSYGLETDQLILKVEQGYKKGQAIIYVTQLKATNETDNILTLYYNSQKIPKTVSLTIKCGDLAKLVYVSGPTKGDVINPPITTFKPVDAYGNLYTDLFTNPTSQDYLNSLTLGQAGVPLSSNNYLDDNKFLKVQYLSRISTNVTVTSPYFEDDEYYKYRIRSGPIDKDVSYAELKDGGNKVGEEYHIVIYPRDKYNNEIDDLSEVEMRDFYTYYGIIGANDRNNVTDCHLIEETDDSYLRKLTTIYEMFDSIECQTYITKAGSLAFHVDYIKDEIECRNCQLFLVSNTVSYRNTKTYYRNREVYLSESELNEVEAKVEPVFELTFFDEYLNQLDAQVVQKLNIEPTLEVTDIKLCISNAGNKKIIVLCPSTNGDENLNKWEFITNRDDYILKLQDKDDKNNVITYPIKIVGGPNEGSSDPVDLSKTHFEPEVIKTQAGVEGETLMELRTAKNVRKNYWYTNPSEKIKVQFNKDQDTCTYQIEKGGLPGQYVIKVTCTKSNDDNGFNVIVDSTLLEKTIKLIVTSGPAYYLEVEDTEKFLVSSDKYTWKVNPTNDDTVSFSFKLKDRYENYITHSVLEDNEITITSETFGSSDKYYNLTFNNKNIDYLFIDKIEEYVNKHIWDIVCVESKRKYSFIYTKVPGKVDVTKSTWTIDKRNYILYETSTVLITLVDRLGVNVGIVEGRLLKEKEKIEVVADNYGKNSLYNYYSVTNDYRLKYTFKYQLVGKYNVSVTYDNKQIKDKKEVSVSYQQIDLQKSMLYYNLYNGKDNLMLTTEQTNIDNKKEYLFYKLFLYTPQGELITIYDKSIKVTCKMTYSKSEDEWELDVNKGNSYINLTYKDGFRTKFEKLPFGSYSLHITLDGQKVVYPLYLLGEKDVSIYNDYDLSKTYINPTYIDGIAGRQYEIDIEFRAKDNLRWNYEININSFDISNSYKLNNKELVIVKKLGEKNGQMKLLVTQYVASTGGVDNMLSFTYKSEAIPTPVTLHIKCAEFSVLEYHSGAVDGTVVNPSIVKFIPKDSFGNLYTDLFDENLYPKEKLAKLTNGVSVEGYPLTTNNFVSDGKFLNVQYGCKNVTTIKVTCNNNLNSETYKYKLWSGPVDPDKSYAEIEKTKNVVAGDISKLIIYPKDMYGNNVTNLTKDDLDKFNVDYEVNKDNKVDISKSCGIAESLLPKCKANVTKSGDVVFTVDYSDKPVNCRNCAFFINPDKIDFSKTKVFDKNENKEMSKTELNTLTVATLPNFELHFFDRFMNPTINKTEVEELPVDTEFAVTDVKLCVKNNGLTKLSTVCKTNNNENEDKWSYLTDGDKYKLLVTKTKTPEQLTYPCKVIGRYKEGSPEPIDPLKTYINPNEITLVAGEEGPVLLELRTSKNERKNYWYKEPEKHISVQFPEKVKNCSYSLSQYEKPGQYHILFNCTKKYDPFNTTVFVEETEVPTKITTTVVPAGPAKSKLFRMNYTEITDPDLGSVSVEDKFQMINILYDKYDNQITNINFALSSLQIKMSPVNAVLGHQYSAEPLAQKNGEIIITLKSTYANKHVVTGLYFPNKYNILFTHGQPWADNSLLEVSKTEAWVGEEVKIYITPYDRYNNYIDATEFAETSPYQVKYTNAGSKTKVIMEKYTIEDKSGLNVLSYNGAFYVKGVTKIDGYIDTQEIKCVLCRINIKTKDVDFLNSYVLRFDSGKNDFELLKNGTVEKNTKEEPIYRLYPRDQYLNDVDFIPKEKLEKYKAYLKNQNETSVYKLKLNNKVFTNQEYAEFIINDDKTVNGDLTYKTLVRGFYDLVFTDEEDNLKYNITLEGDDKGGSNEPADYQKTFIIDQNLTYVAGNNGYMMIEIRTKNNIRKNSWEGFDFTIKSCDENDKTFNFTQERAGTLGVFYITVTTQKANTYPKLTECPLKIYLNKEKIEDLNPLMEVYPDAVVRTNILEKYYQKGSSVNLLDGTADSNYFFEVASFDQYNNLAETVQKVVGIKVTLKGGDEVKNTNSETNNDSGYRGYSVPAKKAGTYIVSTDKSGPKGLYMPSESIFVIHPGVIDLSKTIIKEKATPIQAGTAPAISIDAFDKNGNALYYKDYINNFTAIFIDPKNEDLTSTGEYDKDIQKVYYTSDTPVTVVGKVKVEVTYNDNEKLDTSKVIIEVIPGDPDPSKSILSRQTSKGIFTQYKNGDSFSVDVKEFLILNITLYDKYNNYISNIPADVQILNPIMSGNQMQEIKFNVTQNTGYFELDFNDNSNYIYVYQHLVTGTYDLTYVVNTSLAEASFKYNILVSNGNTNHGNGPYVIEKCILKPKNVSFVAGNYEQFTLELRTKEGLLYNDDINITTDLLIQIVEEDPSFTASVTKAGSDYGIYTIKIYSEKMGDYTMNVLLADPSTQDKKKREVGPGFYRVYPDKVPDKRYTVITTRPEPTINGDNNFEISYTLADKFNNSFIGRNDMVDNKYLTLINNDEPLDVVSLTLSTKDKQTYTMIVYPKYPPKNMSMNVLYNDGENTVYCFPDNINVTINTGIEFYQTQIVSSNKDKIKVGEVLDMWLYTFDKKGVCLGEEDYSKDFKIIVTGPMDSVHKDTKEYDVIKTNNKNGSECTNEYKIVTDDNKDKYKYSGDYTIKVMGGSNIIAQYKQVCYPLGYSLKGFLLEYDFDPHRISILDTVSFTVSGTDEYGNKVEEPLLNDIEISFTKGNQNTAFESQKTEIVVGKLQFDVAIRVIGSHQLHMFYRGDEVLTVNNGEKLPIFTIIPGPCRAENNDHFDLSPLDETQEGEIGYFSFQCYDIYNNKITHGGEQFTVTGQLISNTIEYPINNIEVIDNNNGKYDVKFFAKFEGTYFFNLLVGQERYGQEVKWTLKNKECTGENSILCPNVNKCVKDIIDCVTPEDKCKDDRTKPFWCKVGGVETCVASQTECDCPLGYIKCDIMNYCVREDREDMCAFFLIKSNFCSKKFGTQYTAYVDGICRLKSYHGPNQRVCPIGQVLCADLSCRNNYYECPDDEIDVCPENKVRCIGQAIVNELVECPSTFTCPNEDDVVCSNGECVSNEIECPALQKCNDPDKSYRCQNNDCKKDYESCPQPIACGHQFSLCSDSKCRDVC